MVGVAVRALQHPDGGFTGMALVGKGSLVAHQKCILWSMGGVPQNSRHKNKNSVAHMPRGHGKSYFCGAPVGGAPQKKLN
jgi:hypothetical protein